ncbi:SIT3, silicic acid transporter-like protein, partial [Thalassiosira pseudonana CCMP1335]
MTPITAVKYTYSLALLAFSIILIVSVIFNQGTKLSTVNPWLALCVMVGTIVWLGMMEGQQGALVGLTGVVDHLVYKESHSLAFRNTQLAYRGDNLDRYVTGRQFMVLMCVFVINLCGSPLPGMSESSLNLPQIIEEIFLKTGIAMILMTAMISQLPPQVNASHCMIDFINNYFALFTLYTALIIEFSGVMHASYLIQNIISLISGKPVKTREEPRTRLQASFFWLRVLMSLSTLCFSMAVTVVALFQGKTTMWQGVPEWVSLVLFFVLLTIVGMLEGMQIAFLATSKMRREQRGTSFFGKKTVEVISKKNGQNLPAFFIGRQLMVVGCFFILARVTTPDVEVGTGNNIFGVSDGAQAFLNTGLHAALLMTILASNTWKLAASTFPVAFVNLPFTYILLWCGLILEATGICSGAWVLARILKRVTKLKYDEEYVGTPE